MDQLSNKLKKVLNELAILNHPEQKNNKNFYSNSQLLDISKLCSESYLLAQMLLENITVVLETTVDKIPEQTNAEPKLEEVKQVIETAPIAETKPIEEVVEPPPAAVEKPTILEPEPTKEEKKEEPVVKNTIDNKTSNDLSKAISITRRFEYVSKLFKGDENAYLNFVTQINHCNGDNWLSIYENHYTKYEWSKKAESASELKAVVSKFMQ